MKRSNTYWRSSFALPSWHVLGIVYFPWCCPYMLPAWCSICSLMFLIFCGQLGIYCVGSLLFIYLFFLYSLWLRMHFMGWWWKSISGCTCDLGCRLCGLFGEGFRAYFPRKKVFFFQRGLASCTIMSILSVCFKCHEQWVCYWCFWLLSDFLNKWNHELCNASFGPLMIIFLILNC